MTLEKKFSIFPLLQVYINRNLNNNMIVNCQIRDPMMNISHVKVHLAVPECNMKKPGELCISQLTLTINSICSFGHSPPISIFVLCFDQKLLTT